MNAKIIVPPPYSGGFSFREVGSKIEKALKLIGVDASIGYWSNFYMPNIKLTIPMEFATWDLLIFVMTIAPNSAMLFNYYASPMMSKRSFFYGVTEGHSVLDDSRKQLLHDKVVVPSEFVKQMLQEEGVRVRAVIPHGIDHEEWKTDPAEVERWRSQFGDRHVFYYLANNTSRKGIPNLIRSLSYVKKKLGEPFIAIIDTGPEEDEVIKFRKLVYELDLEDHVQVNNVFGKMTRKEVAIKMHGCDLFLFASHAEGFGIPLVEAMACGKAPICVDAPPMNEIVKEECGFLVPYEKIEWENYVDIMIFKKHMYDPETYADQIIYALQHPKELKEKSIKAYERSLLYDYKKVYLKFIDIL